MKTILLTIAGMPNDVALLVIGLFLLTGSVYIILTITSERKCWRHKDGKKFNKKQFDKEVEEEVIRDLTVNKKKQYYDSKRQKKRVKRNVLGECTQ